MSEDLYIRTDANPTLGIGHMMRCKTIAQEWMNQGGDCTFLVADKASAAIAEQLGLSAICLQGNWKDLSCETESLKECIRKHDIKKILIDSYYISPAYFSTLHPYTKTAYMGGTMDESIRPVDMLINYNITADVCWYGIHYSDVITLLGSNYFPLRKEFKNISAIINDRVENLLLLTGGGDSCHMALQMSQFLLEHTCLKLHVVLGTYNPDIEPLYGLQKNNPRLQLYQNVANMAALMKKCDLAISAGGITLYELCACKLPTITYVIADNQLAQTEEFHKQNIMKSIGDVRTVKSDVWQKHLLDTLESLCGDRKKRVLMADKMGKLVDGEGTGRIVKHLLEL